MQRRIRPIWGDPLPAVAGARKRSHGPRNLAEIGPRTSRLSPNCEGSLRLARRGSIGECSQGLSGGSRARTLGRRTVACCHMSGSAEALRQGRTALHPLVAGTYDRRTAARRTGNLGTLHVLRQRARCRGCVLRWRAPLSYSDEAPSTPQGAPGPFPLPVPLGPGRGGPHAPAERPARGCRRPRGRRHRDLRRGDGLATDPGDGRAGPGRRALPPRLRQPDLLAHPGDDPDRPLRVPDRYRQDRLGEHLRAPARRGHSAGDARHGYRRRVLPRGVRQMAPGQRLGGGAECPEPGRVRSLRRHALRDRPAADLQQVDQDRERRAVTEHELRHFGDRGRTPWGGSRPRRSRGWCTSLRICRTARSTCRRPTWRPSRRRTRRTRSGRTTRP